MQYRAEVVIFQENIPSEHVGRLLDRGAKRSAPQPGNDRSGSGRDIARVA
jgi:hypothetical protein